MRVILYARVSNDEKPAESVSIAGQFRELREYADFQGWTVLEEFQDAGISGRSDHRPGFRSVVELVQNPPEPIDAVLVWSFSRFSRNYQHARLYRVVLERHGVVVLSVKEPFESPFVRLLDGLADFYCHKIAMYTKMAMRERILQGYSCGGVPPFGYCRKYEPESNKSSLEPDPNNAPIVQKIFELYHDGHQIREIVEILTKQKTIPIGEWNYGKIYRILKNRVYTGARLWGKGEDRVCIPQAHTAVVTEEIYLEVQTIMKTRVLKTAVD